MITVVGGTYRELCIEPNHNEIYGSGLRAVKLLLENTDDAINFYTSGNSFIKSHLSNYCKVYNKLSTNVIDNDVLFTFKYSFFLDNPNIYPSVNSNESKNLVRVKDKNVICFGMLDSNFQIDAEKVVFDPQSSCAPISFNDSSNAKELVYIVNLNEAKVLSKKEQLDDILEHFFCTEKVFALIIKNGPYGATLFESKSTKYEIPVFKSSNVFKIGSGDIFTTVFGYYWLSGQINELKKCAEKASKITAIYCEYGAYSNLFKGCDVMKQLKNLKIEHSEIIDKQVYLAGPIFSLSNLILIDKVRDCFIDMGIRVFSPYHDVGIGDSTEIAKSDIVGIDTSDIVFAIIDGLDSGTMIELGYAMSKGKKIVGYNKNENVDSLLMLSPANCVFHRDLTSAIYHTIWNI
ncbi:hypothetical protein EO244_12760 [Ancylomarina salipaludis]|uniref:Carbohydrate kinase PfkB domain-containing protein n=1 Tax=Ancylomarina salipaludis TaxID=2501299 RepID=A0A4V1MZW8_9BACT|nr:nucleoside 2-deoxyribosyltransferase [Ancylomarina salipaludis]RXQ90969.1 hypothetical protein EO244_12760 [Ancylomarina salipaludis]